jgi:hypothetical protein
MLKNACGWCGWWVLTWLWYFHAVHHWSSNLRTKSECRNKLKTVKTPQVYIPWCYQSKLSARLMHGSAVWRESLVTYSWSFRSFMCVPMLIMYLLLLIFLCQGCFQYYQSRSILLCHLTHSTSPYQGQYDVVIWMLMGTLVLHKKLNPAVIQSFLKFCSVEMFTWLRTMKLGWEVEEGSEGQKRGIFYLCGSSNTLFCLLTLQ